MNDVMQKSGAAFIQYDNTGKITEISKSYLKPFIVIHGSSTNAVQTAENNTISHTLKGDINKSYKENMESIFNSYKLVLPENGFLQSTKVIQAPIFIALSSSATNDAATFSGKGSLVNQRTVAQDQLLENKNLPISSQYLYE